MNHPLPTFAIVTPSYNQGEYLEATINSVLSQEGDFFINYTIMDGGSTDGSVDIIRKYDDLIGTDMYRLKCKGVKFNWESAKDRGQYDAINRGFARTTGELMAWINSDDLYHQNAFKTLSIIFTRFPQVKWITANATHINRDNSMIRVDTSTLYPRILITKGIFNGKDGRFIQQESTFWRRSLWDKSEIKLNPNYQYASDFELWIRFANSEELVKVNTQIAAFRKHGNQKTSSLQNYDRERKSMRKVTPFYRLYMKFTRLLSKIYLLDRIYLLNNCAYFIHYSTRQENWLLKKVRGRITQI